MKKNFGLLINGKWLKNRETIDVFNPFDGKKISTVSCANSNQINNLIKLVQNTFKFWFFYVFFLCFYNRFIHYF